MKSFNQYIKDQQLISEAPINKHMTHVEDNIIDLGWEGVLSVERLMMDLGNILKGEKQSKNISLTTKWDGAPAIFCGPDPENGKFFVGTKSVFNKTPKINYTEADIDRNHSGPLADKLKVALRLLKPLGFDTILQGDMMFTKGDIENKTIDGENYVTFQPNTLRYALPADSKSAKEVLKAEVGVVFHTTYLGGPTLQDVSASFGSDISGLKTNSKVWIRDAEFNTEGGATFSPAEYKEYQKSLSKAGKLIKVMNKKFIDELHSNGQLRLLIQTHFNSRIRKGEQVTDPKDHMKDFYEWFELRTQKEIDKVKTEKSKTTKREKGNAIVSLIKKREKSYLALFEYQKTIIDLKDMIIAKFKQIKQIPTFVEKSPGKYDVASPEGFVAIDNLSGNAVKLVDRLEFSLNNFTVPKNWG